MNGGRVESCDFLVLGSGIGGLSYALRVAQSGNVILLTKKENSETATNYAQGGIAAVLGRDDDFTLHIEDTLRCGGGLSRREVVELVVKSGPRIVRELEDLGVGFSRDAQGTAFSLGREGGHSRRRIVHARDRTGHAVERALLEAATNHPRIRIHEHVLAVDFLVAEEEGDTLPDWPSEGGHPRLRCWGVDAYDRVSGGMVRVVAPVTLLATGGSGKVYLYTSNPDICTGDGLAMAYRAGARIANMEFVQFHPTCLYHEGALRNFLITEAVRGEGAELVDEGGRPFMRDYDSRGSLASRDIVARAVDTEMKKHGAKHVYLDLRPMGTALMEERFPHIVARCREAGHDPMKEAVPVVPAAHYLCGGVVTDTFGRTGVAGLFACGEVAHTGLHGANRLASNSLLEAPVFAERAAGLAVEPAWRDAVPPSLPAWRGAGEETPAEAVVFDHDWDEVRRLMWDYVGIVRSDERLAIAASRLHLMREQIEGYFARYRLSSDLTELRNLALVSDLILRCALRRRESRGLHYNRDYPQTRSEYDGRDTVLDPWREEA